VSIETNRQSPGREGEVGTALARRAGLSTGAATTAGLGGSGALPLPF
jgi:hypothetical protein